MFLQGPERVIKIIIDPWKSLASLQPVTLKYDGR